ncbi:MAG TPA: hypothetical protein VIH57_14690 [Bacteroidales bacterium]
MKSNTRTYITTQAYLIIVIMLFSCSCNKFKEYNQKPELESLQQGLKTSAAVAYCVSVASSAFKGAPLPDNVTFDKSSGLIYININKAHPLPFNQNIGDIIVACHWENNSGVMAVLFANIDILGGQVKLYGLNLVPFTERTDGIWAMFARQDIILGNGSDTILNTANISDLLFNTQLDRLNSGKPTDAFVAVKQNVWFINIDQANTLSNVYDDKITISGGGQIAEVKGETGGVIYHALIDAKINYSLCSKNPIDGFALSQNFKAGGQPIVDLGDSFLSFHNTCDGMAHVDFSSGKYVSYFGKNISLNIQ